MTDREKFKEFLDKVDDLCFQYKFEILPNDNKTIKIVNSITGEHVIINFIDGDGGGE